MGLHLGEPEHHRDLRSDCDMKGYLFLVRSADMEGYEFHRVGILKHPPDAVSCSALVDGLEEQCANCC